MKESTRKILYSALQGKLLLRLKVDKYLPQIIFFFVMATAFIGLNLAIESTVHQKEENKEILENLKSMHTEISCKLTALDSVCEVEKMLEEKGSNVRIPSKQAKIVE